MGIEAFLENNPVGRIENEEPIKIKDNGIDIFWNENADKVIVRFEPGFQKSVLLVDNDKEMVLELPLRIVGLFPENMPVYYKSELVIRRI